MDGGSAGVVTAWRRAHAEQVSLQGEIVHLLVRCGLKRACCPTCCNYSDAVHAGLTKRWNSGSVEGHVNRLKVIKRQMYGRAKFDLLRKRVLLAT